MNQIAIIRTGCSPFREVRGIRGQGLTEYLIVVALIAVLVVVGIRYFGVSVKGQLEEAAGHVESLGNRRVETPEITALSPETRAPETRAPGPQESVGKGNENAVLGSTVVGAPGVGAGSQILAEGEQRDKYSQAVSKLHRGVGDSAAGDTVVKEIRIDLAELWLFAAGFCATGLLVILWGRCRGKKKKGMRDGNTPDPVS